jgi:hypothetical protein
MRSYMRDRYHQRRAEAVAILGGKCAVCGIQRNLDIDHIDRSTKAMSVNRMAYVSRERFLLELTKCQLLCKKHHIDKTSSEQSVGHGGGRSGKKNCPCIPCRRKHREYMRARRGTKLTDLGSAPRESPKERLVKLHGTRSGYQIEARLGLARCSACKSANAKYTRELKARKAGV